MRLPAYSTPGALASTLFPGTKTTPALELIDRHLTGLLAKPSGRLIISMPPQEGKSLRVARDFPLWWLTRRPHDRLILASYGDDLAQRNGRAIRNAIRANPQLGLTLASGNASVKDWRLGNEKGGVRSVGIGSGVTGHSANLIVIDDPIKSRLEANSETYRENVWDWWRAEAASRLGPGAPVVLIQTRWHEDDLAGRLAATGDWDMLNIPAQCENPALDPLGRTEGEYLQSAQGRTFEDWERRKREAGSRDWAALYQGHPTPAEGGVLQRAWWQRWTIPPLPQRIIQSWDLTFTGSKGSDYVVGQVWGVDGPNAYLLDQTRGQWSYTEQLARIKELRGRWPQTSVTLIEAAANGHAVIDTLRRDIPGVLAVTPRGGKEARADAIAPLVEAGNVWLPQTRWADDLIEEAAGFPNASHDDQVDALTQALTYLYLPDPRTRQGSQFFDIG